MSLPHCAVRRVRLRVELLEGRAVPSAVATPTYLQSAAGDLANPFGSPGPVGLTPAQIRHAYGFDAVTFGSVVGDGTGQTIAVIDAYDDPKFVSSTSPAFATSDLHNFDAAFGLPDPVFTKVNQTGGTSYPAGNTGWGTEIALDVEWAHAIAPKAAILLVEARSASYADLFAAVNYAKGVAGVSAVSMSFGGSETSGETGYDGTFTTPAGHQGVTFLASTGDSGAPAGYPAYSPRVVAVGGTTLTTGAGGTYAGEVGWADSGGGISRVEAKPGYQSGVTQSSTRRTTPDVALDADPNSGVAVYDSYGEGSAAPWIAVGGTSFSAPAWAGLIAIADQGRVLAGGTTLDGYSQTLPALYAAPAAHFHDVTAGNNGYPAGVGYDLVTGRGTPVVLLIVTDLVSPTSPPPSPPPSPPASPPPATYTYPAPGLPAPIRDFTTTISSVNVPLDLLVSNLTVNLTLTHTYDSDLVVTLTSPSGRVVTLTNRNGGSGDKYTNTVFDSTASTPITAGSAPFTGTFAPQGSLAVFDGLDAKGVWTLRVSDVARFDTGTLVSWSLAVAGSPGTGGPAAGRAAVEAPPVVGSAEPVGPVAAVAPWAVPTPPAVSAADSPTVEAHTGPSGTTVGEPTALNAHQPDSAGAASLSGVAPAWHAHSADALDPDSFAFVIRVD